jgi:hypothetical protein
VRDQGGGKMPDAKCPLCGSQRFFVKDPEDEYEIYEFDLNEGEVIFEGETNDEPLPEVLEDTETYCNKCAWHDKFKALK